MGEFRMPSLGADMERGTMVEWRVAVGDVVHRGDIVAVVETEKSTIEVEVFEDGVIDRLVAAVGDEVEVGGVLAVIAPPAGTSSDAPDLAVPGPVPTTAPTGGAPPRLEGGTVLSPLIRHLADRLGVDLQQVHGTGVNGRVTRADVERAAVDVPRPSDPTAPGPLPPPLLPAASPATRVRATPRARALAHRAGTDLAAVHGSGPHQEIFAADVLAGAALAPPPAGSRGVTPAGPEPTDGRTREQTDEPTDEATGAPTDEPIGARRRAAVGALMGRSKREIPHYYLSTTIDADAAMRWLATTNEQRTVHDRIIPAALLLRATVVAASTNPSMNGHWRGGVFRPSDTVHLGVAVSLRGGGLVAPAIQHAETLDLDELMRRMRDLVGRARAGVLRGSEMVEPTITVTNIGEQGVEQVFGVIYPPQVALVGFGAIVSRPWAVDGMLTVRPLVTATLSADHRASDGHDGARFLATIDRLLQQPGTTAPLPPPPGTQPDGRADISGGAGPPRR